MQFHILKILAITSLLLSACALTSLSKRSAGNLAAQLANDQCRKEFGETPFTASDYNSEFQAGRWRWGEYSMAGIKGYCAKVSFHADGSDPKVRVILSSSLGSGPAVPAPSVPAATAPVSSESVTSGGESFGQDSGDDFPETEETSEFPSKVLKGTP